MACLVLFLLVGQPTLDDSIVIVNNQGAGFFITEDSIITVTHVTVKGTNKIALKDGTKYSATIKKIKGEIAILGVRGLKRPPLKTSSIVTRGQEIRTIGHPLHYDYTLSKGIVSSVKREIKLPNDLVIKDAIQLDCGISQGNSGGPVFNSNNEVIGIIVCINTEGRNIAFALRVK